MQFSVSLENDNEFSLHSLCCPNETEHFHERQKLLYDYEEAFVPEEPSRCSNHRLKEEFLQEEFTRHCILVTDEIHMIPDSIIELRIEDDPQRVSELSKRSWI